MESYLSQLSEKEKVAMEIAKRILGSSFDLSLSIGYLNYLKNIQMKNCGLIHGELNQQCFLDHLLHRAI